MTLETYWLVVPLAGIGLSMVALLFLWLTKPNRRHGGRAAE